MFSCVTGADFARSIAWARRQPGNPINVAIKEFLMSSNITKTEIVGAIAACEPKAGWSTLDQTPVNVGAGDLRALLEAAKCAHYKNTGGWHKKPPSNSDLFLMEPINNGISDD